ncbi:MAG: hypothetical protein KF893_21315 [Caldilineaceae bacterium]|nr:hypothetical protein [Caldilineaceae bacterium]
MFTLTDVLIDALWILGLAGVFATFSYIDYYRHLRRWRWRDAWQRPCLLTPLSLSLTIFSLGLTLNGVTAYQPAPWWETLIWGVMTLIFAWQTFLYAQAGRRRGWDLPVEAEETHEVAEAPKEQIGAEQSQ